VRDPTQHDDLDDDLDAARDESRRTCELCGASGKIASRARGWVSVRCEDCEALDAAEEACAQLPVYADGQLKAERLDEARVLLARLGEAAGRQSPQRRAGLPGVDWARLDRLRLAVLKAMTAAEVRGLILEQVPAIRSALR
jgi:hypothetical protein